jgi:hypothetical protein
MDDISTSTNSIAVEGDTSDYTFTYNSSQKDEDGHWIASNHDGKINIDFLQPDIKYCEVKFLTENTQILSPGDTKNTTIWHTKILECTGENYDICPYDTNKGEIVKHPCGEIDNFAEVTSVISILKNETDDISCSN